MSCARCADAAHQVALLFWRERKIDKARKWLNRAVTLDPDNGDCHAAYYAFEIKCGTPELVRVSSVREGGASMVVSLLQRGASCMYRCLPPPPIPLLELWCVDQCVCVRNGGRVGTCT